MHGFTVYEYLLYHDNLIVVLLEKNGRKLISQRTKHIQVWYVFIKGCITVGDINLEHYPIFFLFLTCLCIEGVLIVGWWCSTPCTNSKETLDSVPIWFSLLLCIRFWSSISRGLPFYPLPPHIYSSIPSSWASIAAASVYLVPARSIPACFHYHIPNRAP